jgi:HSP20 family protein
MPTSLTRWDPATEFSTMRNLMDRLFDQSFGRLPSMRGGEDLGPATLSLDVIENGDNFVVKAAIPGVDPKDVDISVEDDVLTIKGDYEKREETNEENYVRRELRYGSFLRTLRLPPTVDAEHADAQFENGMLKLTLPKKAEARARSIKITPNGVIDGQSEAKS